MRYYYNIPGYANSNDYEKAANFYHKNGEKDLEIEMIKLALESERQEYREKEYDRQYRNYWGDFWD